MAGILVAIALGSVVFFSAALIAGALMLRGKWGSIGGSRSSDTFKQ